MRTGTKLGITLAIMVASTTLSHAGWLDKGKSFLEQFTASDSASKVLSNPEISDGLKEALRVGSENVIKQLGATNGFNADPAIHIPLPDSMQKVQQTLGKLGMSGMLDDLETRLNRSAELATPKARKLFTDAISAMTIDDVQAIYNGPNDAATRYFEQKMSAPLAKEMQPIVDSSLAEAGAVKAYDQVMGKYDSIPFVPDVKADLSKHVIDLGIAGIFHYLAQEEAAIRENPAKRTTELLKKVFSK
jgi:hypothetical protein